MAFSSRIADLVKVPGRSKSDDDGSGDAELKEQEKRLKDEKKRERERKKEERKAKEKEEREAKEERKAKEKEEREAEKKYTKGKGAPAPKSSMFKLADLVVENYSRSMGTIEATGGFLENLVGRISKQQQHYAAIVEEDRALSELLSEYADSLEIGTSLHRSLKLYAALMRSSADLMEKETEFAQETLGRSFYRSCMEQVESAQKAKKEFMQSLSKLEELETTIRQQTLEKTVTPSAMAKLSAAENKQVIVKERLRKLGHATLERVSCINDDITTRTTDHICSMIEERYNFFSSASAHYEEAIPHVQEMRSAMAEATYLVKERKFQNDAVLEELGRQKAFNKLISKGTEAEEDKLAVKTDKKLDKKVMNTPTKTRRNRPSSRQQLPFLHVVARSGQVDSISALLSAGKAEVNDTDARGWTALHHSVSCGQLAAAKELISRGANLDYQNGDGNTPLGVAALMEKEDCVILLCRSGADVNKTNKQNESALHLACRVGNDHIVRRLLKYGADTSLVGKHGIPNDLARTSNHLEVCQAIAHHEYKEKVAKEKAQSPASATDVQMSVPRIATESEPSSTEVSPSKDDPTMIPLPISPAPSPPHQRRRGGTGSSMAGSMLTPSSQPIPIHSYRSDDSPSLTSPSSTGSFQWQWGPSPGTSPVGGHHLTSSDGVEDMTPARRRLSQSDQALLVGMEDRPLPRFSTVSESAIGDMSVDEAGDATPFSSTSSIQRDVIGDVSHTAAADEDIGELEEQRVGQRRPSTPSTDVSLKTSGVLFSTTDDVREVEMAHNRSAVAVRPKPTIIDRRRRRSRSLSALNREEFVGQLCLAWSVSDVDERQEEQEEPDEPKILPPKMLYEVVKKAAHKGPTKHMGGGKKQRLIVVDGDEIVIKHKSKEKSDAQECHSSQLLQAIRSRRHPKKIRLIWKFDDRPQTYMFASKTERQRFYEAAWASRHGMNAVSYPNRRHPINVFMSTWNMGECVPTNKALDAFIPRGQYDVYAIAVQECVYQPGEGYDSCEADWFSRIQHHLGDQYIKLAGLSLSNIRLLVLIRRAHYYYITNVKTSSVATGIGGIMGNKGGVGISFSFHDTTICFVGSHLAAHQDEVQARNANYRDIVRQMSRELHTGNPAFDITNQFDHIFWMGDLNYRIDLPRDEVIELVKQKKWLKLQRHDQLLQQVSQGDAFIGFEEESIVFPPTYKYARGQEDVYSEEKQRVPSWCDRVLWRSIPGCELEHLVYGCQNSVALSDHKPVFSAFEMMTYVPAPPTESPSCLLILRQLRIERLRFDANEGMPDPYVSFHGPFLDVPDKEKGSAFQTVVKSKTRNPSWEDSEIPALITICTDIQELGRQALQILVDDKSRHNKKEERRTAQARLPLWQAQGNCPDSSSFAVPLTSNGWSRCGIIRGTVTIVNIPKM